MHVIALRVDLTVRAPQPCQCSILGSPIALRQHDCDAPRALRFAADIAHNAIDGEGEPPLVEPLDHDIAFVGFSSR